MPVTPQFKSAKIPNHLKKPTPSDEVEEKDRQDANKGEAIPSPPLHEYANSETTIGRVHEI